MTIAIVPLEFITDLFTRPVTLALRLFGNMFAGHMLLVLFITGGWYLLQAGGVLTVAGAVTWVFAISCMTLFETAGRVPPGLRLHPAVRALHRRSASPTSTDPSPIA